MKLYEYAAIFNPRTTGKDTEKATILINPTVVLAEDEREAFLKAGRALPEKYMDRLAEVDIVIRPFSGPYAARAKEQQSLCGPVGGEKYASPSSRGQALDITRYGYGEDKYR